MSERKKNHNLQYPMLYYITILALAQQSQPKRIEERQTIQKFCRSLKTCHDCKMADFECEWCHDTGCTNEAKFHCPKKVFLDNFWKRGLQDRYCTEIITKNPIFVPANFRSFIKMDLRIDDLTLHYRSISCEIYIARKVIRVGGSLDKDMVYCDMTVLRSHLPVTIGYLRLYWGGAEPYSNTMLMIVYSCREMARSCKDCQELNRDFKCGWCQETYSCSLVQECPRQTGYWVSKKLTCEKNLISQHMP